MGTNTTRDDDGSNARTRSSDPLAARAHGTAGTTGGTDGVGDHGEREGAGRDADPRSPDDTARFAWLAVLPAVATLAGIGVGLVVGFDVFDTTTPGPSRLYAYALLVPYFLLGVAGTRWLVEDATRLAAAGAAWQPNPWYYVLGGGLVLELYYLLPVLAGSGPATADAAYLVGGFVVSLLLSSVVAGPVYVLQRRRRLR